MIPKLIPDVLWYLWNSGSEWEILVRVILVSVVGRCECFRVINLCVWMDVHVCMISAYLDEGKYVTMWRDLCVCVKRKLFCLCVMDMCMFERNFWVSVWDENVWKICVYLWELFVCLRYMCFCNKRIYVSDRGIYVSLWKRSEWE